MVSPKKPRKHAVVTQGSGAAALITKAAVVTPPAPVPLLPPFFFTVTALNPYGESDYSNEVAFTNSLISTNGKLSVTAKSVTLGWDANDPADGVTNYKGYVGRTSGVYAPVVEQPSNLTIQVILYPPFPGGSNEIIQVTGSTNVSLTNPVAPMMLWKGTNLSIKVLRE